MCLLLREQGEVATRSVDGGIVKVPQTSSLRHFWRFSFFAQSRYHRTSSLARKRNSIPFLEVCQRVEIYNLTFSTR